MYDFRKVANKLGLKDLGNSEVIRIMIEKRCPKCGAELRLGEDQQKYQWSYCPRCQNKLKKILVPGFLKSIKLEPQNHRDN